MTFVPEPSCQTELFCPNELILLRMTLLTMIPLAGELAQSDGVVTGLEVQTAETSAKSHIRSHWVIDGGGELMRDALPNLNHVFSVRQRLDDRGHNQERGLQCFALNNDSPRVSWASTRWTCSLLTKGHPHPPWISMSGDGRTCCRIQRPQIG